MKDRGIANKILTRSYFWQIDHFLARREYIQYYVDTERNMSNRNLGDIFVHMI